MKTRPCFKKRTKLLAYYRSMIALVFWIKFSVIKYTNSLECQYYSTIKSKFYYGILNFRLSAIKYTSLPNLLHYSSIKKQRLIITFWTFDDSIAHQYFNPWRFVHHEPKFILSSFVITIPDGPPVWARRQISVPDKIWSLRKWFFSFSHLIHGSSQPHGTLV